MACGCWDTRRKANCLSDSCVWIQVRAGRLQRFVCCQLWWSGSLSFDAVPNPVAKVDGKTWKGNRVPKSQNYVGQGISGATDLFLLCPSHVNNCTLTKTSSTSRVSNHWPVWGNSLVSSKSSYAPASQGRAVPPKHLYLGMLGIVDLHIKAARGRTLKGQSWLLAVAYAG